MKTKTAKKTKVQKKLKDHLFSSETSICVFCGTLAEDAAIEGVPCPVATSKQIKKAPNFD